MTSPYLNGPQIRSLELANNGGFEPTFAANSLQALLARQARHVQVVP
jgi:hypothetical protein